MVLCSSSWQLGERNGRCVVHHVGLREGMVSLESASARKWPLCSPSCQLSGGMAPFFGSNVNLGRKWPCVVHHVSLEKEAASSLSIASASAKKWFLCSPSCQLREEMSSLSLVMATGARKWPFVVHHGSLGKDIAVL